MVVNGNEARIASILKNSLNTKRSAQNGSALPNHIDMEVKGNGRVRGVRAPSLER
jgi:hypothetical protein